MLSNSAEFGIVNQEEYFDKKIAKHIENYYVVEHNNFVYNPRISNRAPYGPIRRNTLTNKGVMSPLYYVFSVRSVSHTYLDYYFKSGKWYKFMYQNGDSGARSDRFSIKDKVLQLMPIQVPSHAEQDKIGQLLQTVDKTLLLYQQKLSLLKQLKQGMLQKLFTNLENKQPLLRFNEFHGDWEQRLLSDIAKITMGQSPNSRNYTDNPNDHVLVQGNADLTNGQILPRIWTKQVTKSIEKGDILLTVRAPVGEVAIANMDAVIGRGVASLKANKFVYYFLQTLLLKHTWNKLSSGSTFQSISSDDIKNLTLGSPNVNEQNQISTLMLKIENILSLYQNKINILTNLKRFLLQQMFI